MARDTPPSIISYTETASWVTGAASKATASISWNTGDILVALGGSEGPDTLGVPTATGLTFASQVLNGATGCGTRIATATAGSTSSSAVTMANPNNTRHWGFGVWVLRGSDGVGTNGEQHTATKTKSITATDTHSAVIWGAFDFAAGAAGSGTPSPTHQRQSAADPGGNYTFLVVDLADQASSGATSYGQTGGGATGPFSIAIVEILGTTSGAVASLPELVMAPITGR